MSVGTVGKPLEDLKRDRTIAAPVQVILFGCQLPQAYHQPLQDIALSFSRGIRATKITVK